MERIYCDYYCYYGINKITAYDPISISCECTWRIANEGCCFDDIEDLKKDGVYCPFWDVEGGWIDAQLLGEIDEYV